MIEEILKISILSICLLILHEMTHMFVFAYYEIPFKFTITKKLILGFKINLVYQRGYKEQIYLLPLLWAIPIGLCYGWLWGIFTIMLGMKDIYDYIRLSIK